MPKLDAHDIIRTIAESKKKTPVKVYVKGDLASLEVPEELDAYFGDKAGVLFGDWKDAEKFLKDHSEITGYHVENDGRNTGVPLLDKKKFNARIEPGAIIRDQVEIGDNAVVMMGAVINIGAEIGPGSMIDMGFGRTRNRWRKLPHWCGNRACRRGRTTFCSTGRYRRRRFDRCQCGCFGRRSRRQRCRCRCRCRRDERRCAAYGRNGDACKESQGRFRS